MENDKEIDVSVIIPTFNRSEVLETTLLKLIKNTEKLNYEILIIDNNSDQIHKNKYNLLVKKIKNGRLLSENNQGPAAARNLGIRKSKGNILIFINDDTEVGFGFIVNHLNFHNRNKKCNIGVIGPFKEKTNFINNAAIRWLVNKSGQHFNYDNVRIGRITPWYYLWTCNMSLKRKFIIKNKLFFDESFPTAAWEDIEFAYRAKKRGLKIYFDDRLKAWHKHYFNLDDVLGRFYSHGRGLYHLKNKLPKNFLPPLGNFVVMKFVSLFYDLILYKFWKLPVIRYLKFKDIAPNFIMQVLVIGLKIEGYKYEKNRIQN